MSDVLQIVEELAACEHRAAGSDAERRAARLLALRLRRSGRRGTRVATHWVRPSALPVQLLLCAAGVIGSVLAIEVPVAGLATVGAALLLLLLDLDGRVQPLRRLTRERATQDVVAPDPRDGLTPAVRLLLTAAVDAPRPLATRRGPLGRFFGRARARLNGHLLGPHGVLVASLILIVVLAALRVAAGDDVPGALGAVQLIPTLALIALIGLLADGIATRPDPRAEPDAAAVAAVIEVARELDRRPPRNLAVDVVLAGAGDPEALGLRRAIRDAKAAGATAQRVAVLHVAACGAGHPVWWERNGLVLAPKANAQLRRLAEEVAASEPDLHARATQGRTRDGAVVARAAGLPSLAVGALGKDDGPGATRATGAGPLDVEAVEETIAFLLGLVAALDADVGPAKQGSGASGPSAGRRRSRPRSSRLWR